MFDKNHISRKYIPIQKEYLFNMDYLYLPNYHSPLVKTVEITVRPRPVFKVTYILDSRFKTTL